MIVHPRDTETTPIPTPSAPWALTGWGVALLGVGFALAVVAVVAG